jgi:hypothetical protein
MPEGEYHVKSFLTTATMPAKLNPIVVSPGPIGSLPLPVGLPVSAKDTEPLENPASVGQREEIREVTRRVMGSRQSGRRPEHSRSRRQPKRGHGSQRRASD